MAGEQLRDVARRHSVDITNILAADEFSRSRIERAKVALNADGDVPDGLDAVVFGSMGRLEATAESDFDFLVIANRLPDDPQTIRLLLSKVDALRLQWVIEEGRSLTEATRPPGSSGLFGRAIGAFDLIECIGLQDDTNHSLTRRMLLLEESRSLMRPEVHQQVVRAALARYLDLEGADTGKVPRFLLNDVVRYWRTITVDFQAKAWGEESASGLRYLKLLIPRKLMFAGTLMSLLMCGKTGGHASTVDDLCDQFEMSPLDRLVAPYLLAPGHVQEAMADVVRIADLFIECSSAAEWRTDVASAKRSEHVVGSNFAQMRDEASKLQANLELIFFDWELLKADARKMLVF